jgi:hypothetical protein
MKGAEIMQGELKIQGLKDKTKSFELGRFVAQSKGQNVVVMDGNRPVMCFDAQGVFSEVQCAPLRLSMAALLHDQMYRDRHCDYYTLGLLAEFQNRGGKL